MDEIDLIEYVRILAKRARFILVVAFGSALVALIVLQFVPRTYRGEAMLIFPKTENSTALLSKLGGIPGLVDLGVPGLSGQGMYSDVLQSRTLSSRIVDELQLSAVEVKPEDLQEQLELTPTKAGALQLACYASTGWVKSGKLKWLDQKMPRASVKEKTAYLAAEITNLYVKRLQDFDREHSHVTSKSHRVFLQGEVDTTHRQLSDAENALRHFKELHPVVVPPEAVEAQVTQVVELRKAQIEAASELGEVEQSIDEARKVVAGQTAVLTAAKVIQENPVVTELQNQLAAAEVQRARMLENMTEKHPSVVAATEQAAKLQEKIGKEVARVTSSETIEISNTIHALSASA
jgi:uncharacterized protein involved in exopolysaccharide biosynthesis